MDHGKLLALDSVDALIEAHGGESRVIARRAEGNVEIATNDPLAELQKLQAQSTLQTFRVEWPDLEHVFLNLTGRSLRD